MKYVKTYEGWWFKRKKAKEIDPIPDPITSLRQKIDDALSEIHINGSNFVDVDYILK